MHARLKATPAAPWLCQIGVPMPDLIPRECNLAEPNGRDSLRVAPALGALRDFALRAGPRAAAAFRVRAFSSLGPLSG